MKSNFLHKCGTFGDPRSAWNPIAHYMFSLWCRIRVNRGKSLRFVDRETANRAAIHRQQKIDVR